MPSPSVGHRLTLLPHHLQTPLPAAPLLAAPLSAAPGPTAPLPVDPTARKPHCRSLSEQMTPAAKRVPVFLQFRLVPWCWQWLRDISWPAHFTPLSTISVTLLASQYHVSWGGGETGWVAGLAAVGDPTHTYPGCSRHPATVQPYPHTQAARKGPVLQLGAATSLCPPYSSTAVREAPVAGVSPGASLLAPTVTACRE